MNREYHQWYSPALQRNMDLLVFGESGHRLLVFPSRKERFFEYEDRGMIHSLRNHIVSGKIQVFCVDGIDQESLYCFDKTPQERLDRHMQYERYIVDEVIPFTASVNPDSGLISHGCSFGAYHAMTIALRHPQHFRRVLAFSGRYDLTLHTGQFYSLFHGFYSDDLRDIMPSHFMPLMKEGPQLRTIRKLQFTLVIGDEDPFYDDNLALGQVFSERKIGHDLHAWCGNAHRFRYWRQMVRIYL